MARWKHWSAAAAAAACLVAGAASGRAETSFAYTVEIKTGNSDLKSRFEEVSRLIKAQSNPPPGQVGLEQRAAGDKDSFQTVMRSEGYYDGDVTIDIDDSKSPIKVTMTVSPGPRYLIGKCKIQYREPAPAKAAKSCEDIGLTAGQPARAEPIIAATQNLLHNLQSHGRPAAITKRVAVVNHLTKKMRLVFRTDPGKEAHFGKVKIAGAKGADHQFLARIVPWKPGALYDVRELDKYRQRLADLNLFDTLTVKPDTKNQSPDGVTPIAVNAHDRLEHSVGLGVKYATDTGPGGKASWENRNLWGRAEDLSLSLELGTLGQSIEASLTLPHEPDTGQVIGFTVKTERDTTDAYDKNGLGALAKITTPLGGHWTGNGGIAFEAADIKQAGNTVFSILGSLPVGVSYDSTKSLLDPIDGERLTFQAQPVLGTSGGARAFLILEFDGLGLSSARCRKEAGRGGPPAPGDHPVFAAGGGAAGSALLRRRRRLGARLCLPACQPARSGRKSHRRAQRRRSQFRTALSRLGRYRHCRLRRCRHGRAQRLFLRCRFAARRRRSGAALLYEFRAPAAGCRRTAQSTQERFSCPALRQPRSGLLMTDRTPTRWRRVLAWSGAALAGLIAGIVGAWQLGALNGPALWAVAEISGYRVSCGTLEGGLLSSFTCTDVKIADAQGTFLKARRLSLAWHPWALIGEGVSVDKLVLDDGVLTRVPQSTSPSTNTGILPGTRIAVADLAVRRFTLAIASAPRACISLGGKAVAGPKGFDAALGLTRCAPKNGQLSFKGHYDKPSGDLALAARGKDDGALLAALTGIENAGPTDIALDGRGTISSFNGTLSLHAENVARVDTRFNARDLTATTLAAKFDIAPALLPAWAPRGPGTVNADVTRGPNGGFDISSVVIDWAGIRGNAQLSLDSDGALNGTVALATTRRFAISGASIGALKARAKVSGTPKQPRLRGMASLADVAAGSTQIAQLQANFTTAPEAGGAVGASIVGHAKGAVLPAPAGGLLGTAFSFHANATRASDGAISVDGTVNGAAAAMVLKAALGKSSGSGHLTVTVPDLAKANAGFGGQATARLDLPQLALNGDMVGTLEIHGAGIAPRGLGAALGKSPVLTAHLRARAGAYVVSDIALDTAAAAVHGNASLAGDGALRAHLQTTRGDLKPLSKYFGRRLKGSFTLSADVTGTGSAPIVHLAGQAPRIRIENNIVKKTELRLDARKQDRWTGKLVVTSATPGGAVDVAANFETVSDGWTLHVAKGELGPAVLSGQLESHGARYAGALELKGHLLEPLGYFLGKEMQGSGTLALRGDGRNLALVADLKDVKTDGLRNATVHADATAEGMSGPLTARIEIKDGDNHVAAAAGGTLSPVAITLTKLDGVWAGAKLALRAPASFTMKNGAFALSNTVIGISGGTLTLAAKGGHGSLQGNLHLSDMPVAPIAALLQLGKAKGAIALDLAANMTPGKTDAQLKLNASGLMFAGAGKADKPANITMTGGWDGHVASVDGRVTGLDDKEATLTARVPMVRSGTGYLPVLARSGPVSAQFRARLRAGRLMALLPVSEQSATGLLSGAADVSGDIANPQFSGKLALTDGSFSDFQTGIKLEKLNATLDATGGSRAVLKLTATDGNSGTVKAEGEFSMAAFETGSVGKLAGHLDMTLNQAQIIRDDLVHGSATGKLALDLPGDQPPAITGKLRTNTVRIDAGAALPPNVPQIEVREINGGPPPSARKAAKTPTLFSTATLDIAVDMPNRVFVTGHGMDSEWSGDLNVTGTLGSPEVSGRLDVVRGQAELIGKTFQLDEGRVRFGPDVPGNATVRIVGTNDSSDISVTVTIEGSVLDPKITWTSSPSLPQSEVLSHLFFGTSTPHLSVGQALQLAELSGQLKSLGLGGGGGGLLSFARGLTGLDVLRFTTPSDLSGGGASIAAGKYITDRVYLGVKQGTDVSAGTAQVEVKITPHITLDAEAGANSNGSVGVTWKWDY